MNSGRQFSLAFLLIESFWIACGLGFATALLHPAVPVEVDLLAIPLVGVCWGTAIGGLFNNMVDGAKAGLLAGFAFLLVAIALVSGP